MHLINAFKYALHGLKDSFQNEKNMKIHTSLTLVAVLLAFFLKLSSIEWALLILTVGLVFTTELVNTSIEETIDVVSPEIREKTRIAKDIAAASVLVSAIVSVLVACFLFIPKIF